MRAKYLGSMILTLLLLSAVAAQGGGDNSLMVQVLEASGRPVKYACVTVIPKEGEIIFRKADGKGRVKLKNVTSGKYRIVVKADGYQAQKREVAVGADGEACVFSLQPRTN
ncbi:MAG TPA: carboxypeptidase-like regulatory domain-containing protein [Pyrinomonadaceae bacterium]|jgi:uncharacterized membrane protein|nr:carboxypeptidase-like regulatory domain-containing protein [Pyrinomonadaceae bacterium]